MKNISAWAIRHPITPIVLFVVLFFLGVVAFIRLPVNLQPDIAFPVVTVDIQQPGAAPTEMETQIAQKVEGSISSIGNVRNMTTLIVEGSVNLELEFQIGTPIDRAVTDVRDAVAKVRNDLPQNISRNRWCNAINVDGEPIRLVRGDDDLDLTPPEQLSWFIDNNVTKRLLNGARSRSSDAQRRRRTERSAWNSILPGCRRMGLTAFDVNEQLRAIEPRRGRRAGAGGRRRTGHSRAPGVARRPPRSAR